MSSGLSKTHYWENLVLLAVKGTPLTAPINLFAALFTVTPGESGGGTEVSGNAYARQAITFGTVSAQSSGSQIANTGAISFPVATGAWGTIVAVAIMDASTGGNMLYYGALTANITINTNGQFVFPIAAVTLLED